MVIYLILMRIKKKYRRHKLTMFDWMQMTNDQRSFLDKEDRNQSLRRKKELLGNIRKEYKKISTNSNQN